MVIRCTHALSVLRVSVPGWNSTKSESMQMFLPFWFPLICKSCNLSLKLTEPTFKPALQYQPKTQSVFYLNVKTASFLVAEKAVVLK